MAYVHHQLVGSGDHFQIVVVVELLSDVLSEGVPGATGVDAPPATVVRVRPQEIAHWALVGDFLLSIEALDVVQGLDGGRQAAMQTEELLLDDGS